MPSHAIRLTVFIACLMILGGVAVNSAEPVRAQAAFDFNISLNGYSLSVAPNHSGFVQVTVNLASGTPQNVTLISVISPNDGLLSASFGQSWGFPSYVTTLVINARNATQGKQYTIIVSGQYRGLVKQAPALTVTISCAQGTCATLTTSSVGQGAVQPSCPSGCSETIGQTISVSAVPDPNWAFGGWNVTGTSCSSGGSPCVFVMPNNPVSITANFIQPQQTQPLYTSYSGEGQLSPSCPSGCPELVGSSVSITATPAPGWQVSGYHLTDGISCGVQAGYICTFTMPNFPVTFTVTFMPTTAVTTTTVVGSSTTQTSVTSTSVVGSTATSTMTTTTMSTQAAVGTMTTSVYYTSYATMAEMESSFATQFSTVTANLTSTMTNLENPPLEAALIIIILLSAMMIGAGIIRRSPRGGAVDCARCGFKNPAGVKFCENCGESLKRLEPHA